LQEKLFSDVASKISLDLQNRLTNKPKNSQRRRGAAESINNQAAVNYFPEAAEFIFWSMPCRTILTVFLKYYDNNSKGQNMDKDSDCTMVDCSVRLQDLKHWKMNAHEAIPFYLHMGDSGGLVFDGKPDIVRNLVRIYNTQRLFFSVKLVSFLNAEGITAHKVAASADDMLGYHAELSNN
jgi:hypothetical protein